MSTFEIIAIVAIGLAALVGYLLGRREVSVLRTRIEERERAFQQQLATLEESRQQLGDRFRTVADEIFAAKSKAVVEQNQQSLNALLAPLRTELDGFRKQVADSVQSTALRHGQLTQELQQLKSLNTQLGEETKGLTRALKGDSKQQGDWGEMVLERVLEQAGLERGVTFEVQQSFTDANGRILRPDVVLHLSKDRYIVVDSKVSLTAYAESQQAEAESQRGALIKQHVESVRGHIRELGDKAYDRLHGDRSPDFVLLFMPVEGALLTALRYDAKLVEFAWERNVVLVSPSTLLFVARCVAQLWDTEKRAKNIQDIANRGAALYDKFRGFAEDLQAVGRDLDRAQTGYTGAMSKLIDGRGSLVRQVEMLRDLGVQPKKQLPAELLERSEGED